MGDYNWKQDASDFDPAAMIREAKADAWDEGRDSPTAYNPYREAPRD